MIDPILIQVTNGPITIDISFDPHDPIKNTEIILSQSSRYLALIHNLQMESRLCVYLQCLPKPTKARYKTLWFNLRET